MNEVLEELIENSSFFQQLSVLNTNGESITGYPIVDFNEISPSLQERRGIELALKEVPIQTYSAQPGEDMTSAQVSFIAPFYKNENELEGVLIGRTDLRSNPYSEVLINNLNTSAGEGGQGLLIDEDGIILSHPNPALVMTLYEGPTSEIGELFSTMGSDGNQRLVYYQPVPGYDWSVVISIPASRVYELTLQIAAPLLAVILIISILALTTLQMGLRKVTGSLKTLSVEADRIAQGKLDHPLEANGEDEVANLRKAFEQMRLSLKARLDELNRLLVVSQGIASSLDLEESLQPVLSAALTSGASSARVVLVPSIIPELEASSNRPTSFALGEGKDLFSSLDEQILALNHRQLQLILANASKQKILNFLPDQPKPESIIAFALRHEKIYYGTLWIAFTQAHIFSSEEVRFIATLASQAGFSGSQCSFIHEC